ncbi:MerR family transcriptional regulator [Lactobacillus taiwanensis]|uniref:MerR family transcriptional regulator n=1 Tax=Lactobacillus taiwanensis TaxID=508451 RepID=UPI002681525B
MADAKLLSISEFAKLEGTTRRTLIFYDQKDIFKPLETRENGYHYYSYEQLYQIGFILGLRDLELSVEEVKDYLSDSSSDALNKKLIPLKGVRILKLIVRKQKLPRHIVSFIKN